MFLSEQQIRFFRDTGFIKISEIISDEDVEKMKSVILQHIDDRTPPYRSGSCSRVSRIDQVISRDSVFKRVFCSPVILNPLSSLLGPNIELVLNRHNHATVNSREDTNYRLHRDILQWSRSLVTVMVYLDAADVGNGCTHLIPGSHLFPFTNVLKTGGTWMDEHDVFRDLCDQALPVQMPRGGVLIFDSLVFHSVGKNMSDQNRMSVCMAYRSVDELSGKCTDSKCMLALGERIYRGNDRPE